MSDADFIPAICPTCNEATEPGDHFVTTADTYHVICYQKACIASGLPDPFPLCDYCDQIIWEFDGDELKIVVRGQICEYDPITKENNWRPACWHPECAPGADESPEIDRTGDRVDNPPDQPAQHGTLDAASTGNCSKCAKPIQRSRTVFEGEPYHKRCAAMARAAKVPRKLKSNRHRCTVCTDPIDPGPDGNREVECELDDGTLQHYHKKCYREAVIGSGQPDPYPPRGAAGVRGPKDDTKKPRVKKEPTVHCGICSTNVPRVGFAAHVQECSARAEAEQPAAEDERP